MTANGDTDYPSAMAELLATHGFRRFVMSRTKIGHLLLAGHLGDRPIDIVLDTGAGKTFVELSYCRSLGLTPSDMGQTAAPAAGATSSAAANVHILDGVRFSLDGLQLESDGMYAIDMAFTNEKLKIRGVDPIRAVIGQDVLRNHRAVIDYASLALHLKAGAK